MTLEGLFIERLTDNLFADQGCYKYCMFLMLLVCIYKYWLLIDVILKRIFIYILHILSTCSDQS